MRRNVSFYYSSVWTNSGTRWHDLCKCWRPFDAANSAVSLFQSVWETLVWPSESKCTLADWPWTHLFQGRTSQICFLFVLEPLRVGYWASSWRDRNVRRWQGRIKVNLFFFLTIQDTKTSGLPNPENALGQTPLLKILKQNQCSTVDSLISFRAAVVSIRCCCSSRFNTLNVLIKLCLDLFELIVIVDFGKNVDSDENSQRMRQPHWLLSSIELRDATDVRRPFRSDRHPSAAVQNETHRSEWDAETANAASGRMSGNDAIEFGWLAKVNK